ncbi:MAG: hypothetical protein K6A30_02820 [Lachnospiraceae bacterium]|nr:hypothetical protein [Lachnospiraceae bacterium]
MAGNRENPEEKPGPSHLSKKRRRKGGWEVIKSRVRTRPQPPKKEKKKKRWLGSNQIKG